MNILYLILEYNSQILQKGMSDIKINIVISKPKMSALIVWWKIRELG